MYYLDKKKLQVIKCKLKKKDQVTQIINQRGIAGYVFFSSSL